MRRLAILASTLVFATIALGADTPVPAADLASAKDPASLGRFTGSTMLTHTSADYDSLTIPLDALKPVPGQRDGKNNAVHAPSKKVELEGRRQHYLYLLPEGASPLAAIRNYQNAAKAKGGKSLYECLGEACGGGQRTVNSGGGGNQSIGMLLWPSDKVIDKHTSAAGCAMRSKITEQRFTALEIPAASLHAAVLAFGIEASAECKNFNNRTFVMVDTLESKAMAQTMDTPSANDMVASITTSGRVALYGILFDSGRTDVKPESKATMDEIAKLLSANRSLKLLVVGHTDNVGGFAPNLELSKRRAEAVVAQLVSQYKIDAKRLQAFGVSYASPVAANTDEAGRGRNRRVELVAN
jgi:outer membrane protein OmpA-like peptidoglycan-associated protein